MTAALQQSRRARRRTTRTTRCRRAPGRSGWPTRTRSGPARSRRLREPAGHSRRRRPRPRRPAPRGARSRGGGSSRSPGRPAPRESTCAGGAARQSVDQLGGQLTRVAAGPLGGGQRNVRRPVPVLAMRRPLELDHLGHGSTPISASAARSASTSASRITSAPSSLASSSRTQGSRLGQHGCNWHLGTVSAGVSPAGGRISCATVDRPPS